MPFFATALATLVASTQMNGPVPEPSFGTHSHTACIVAATNTGDIQFIGNRTWNTTHSWFPVGFVGQWHRAMRALPCNYADAAKPYHEHDIFDVVEFTDRVMNQNPLADLNQDGLVDHFDVMIFVDELQAGCTG